MEGEPAGTVAGHRNILQMHATVSDVYMGMVIKMAAGKDPPQTKIYEQNPEVISWQGL